MENKTSFNLDEQLRQPTLQKTKNLPSRKPRSLFQVAIKQVTKNPSSNNCSDSKSLLSAIDRKEEPPKSIQSPKQDTKIVTDTAKSDYNNLPKKKDLSFLNKESNCNTKNDVLKRLLNERHCYMDKENEQEEGNKFNALSPIETRGKNRIDEYHIGTKNPYSRSNYTKCKNYYIEHDDRDSIDSESINALRNASLFSSSLIKCELNDNKYENSAFNSENWDVETDIPIENNYSYHGNNTNSNISEQNNTSQDAGRKNSFDRSKISQNGSTNVHSDNNWLDWNNSESYSNFDTTGTWDDVGIDSVNDSNQDKVESGNEHKGTHYGNNTKGDISGPLKYYDFSNDGRQKSFNRKEITQSTNVEKEDNWPVLENENCHSTSDDTGTWDNIESVNDHKGAHYGNNTKDDIPSPLKYCKDFSYDGWQESFNRKEITQRVSINVQKEDNWPILENKNIHTKSDDTGTWDNIESVSIHKGTHYDNNTKDNISGSLKCCRDFSYDGRKKSFNRKEIIQRVNTNVNSDNTRTWNNIEPANDHGKCINYDNTNENFSGPLKNYKDDGRQKSFNRLDIPQKVITNVQKDDNWPDLENKNSHSNSNNTGNWDCIETKSLNDHNKCTYYVNITKKNITEKRDNSQDGTKNLTPLNETSDSKFDNSKFNGVSKEDTNKNIQSQKKCKVTDKGDDCNVFEESNSVKYYDDFNPKSDPIFLEKNENLKKKNNVLEKVLSENHCYMDKEEERKEKYIKHSLKYSTEEGHENKLLHENHNNSRHLKPSNYHTSRRNPYMEHDDRDNIDFNLTNELSEVNNSSYFLIQHNFNDKKMENYFPNSDTARTLINTEFTPANDEINFQNINNMNISVLSENNHNAGIYSEQKSLVGKKISYSLSNRDKLNISTESLKSITSVSNTFTTKKDHSCPIKNSEYNKYQCDVDISGTCKKYNGMDSENLQICLKLNDNGETQDRKVLCVSPIRKCANCEGNDILEIPMSNENSLYQILDLNINHHLCTEDSINFKHKIENVTNCKNSLYDNLDFTKRIKRTIKNDKCVATPDYVCSGLNINIADPLHNLVSNCTISPPIPPPVQNSSSIHSEFNSDVDIENSVSSSDWQTYTDSESVESSHEVLHPDHISAISNYLIEVEKKRSVEAILANEVLVSINKTLQKSHDYSDCKVTLYGSFLSDTAVSTSNLNLAISILPKGGPNNNYFRSLQKMLSEKLTRYYVEPFEDETENQRKVKIFLTEPESGVNCELVYCGSNVKKYQQTNRLLKSIVKYDKRIKTLIIAARIWAETCFIYGTECDKLPPICFVLFVVHFLQIVQPPIVPPILIDEYKSDMVLNKLLFRNEKEVGELWLEFLKYYSEVFDWDKEVVTICSETPVYKSSKSWERFCIAVEDPFSDKNVAENIQMTENAEQVKICFTSSYHYFMSPISNQAFGAEDETKSSQSEKFDFSFQKCMFCQPLPTYCEDCDNCTDGYCEKHRHPNFASLENLPKLNERSTKSVNQVLNDISKNLLYDKKIKGRKNFIADLEKFLRKFIPGARLTLFGSSVNMFGFLKSDLDICMTIDHKSEKEVNVIQILKRVATNLRKNVLYENIFFIPCSQVPLVKFHFKSQCDQFNCDLSMYNHLAVHNSLLLSKYAMLDERCRILGCALKYLTKKGLVGDSSSKYLSSYCYILMVIHYLQQITPPILPVLPINNTEIFEKYLDVLKEAPEALQKKNDWFTKTADELKNSFSSNNNSNLADLWLGLLEFYLTYNNKYAINITQIEPMPSSDLDMKALLFNINDPFIPGDNLGSKLREEKKVNETLEVFTRARSIFGKNMPAGNIGDLEKYYFSSSKLTGQRVLDIECEYCSAFGHDKAGCPKANPIQRPAYMIKKFVKRRLK